MTASISGRPKRAARTTDCGLPPTPTQVGMWPSGIGGLTNWFGERRPEVPRPGHGLLAQKANEQVELLLEQLLVVSEVEAEEREGVRQRASADDQLRAAVRDGVERGEVGVQPHRVLRAENRDGGAEPDPFRSACDRGEDHMARRVHELRAVVLADVEGVDSDRVGEDSLLDGVPNHLVAADRQPGLGRPSPAGTCRDQIRAWASRASLPESSGTEVLEYAND